MKGRGDFPLPRVSLDDLDDLYGLRRVMGQDLSRPLCTRREFAQARVRRAATTPYRED